MRSTTDPHGDVVAYSLLAKADELVEAGRYEEAAQRAIEHLRRNPDEPQGLAALGKIATLLGALGQAEHFLRAALAKGGDSRPVSRQLASVLEQTERLVDADAMLGALQRAPSDHEPPAVPAPLLTQPGLAPAAPPPHNPPHTIQ